MKALTPEVINGRIIITNKNDYDEVHITVDEMEDVLNSAYQRGAKEFSEWLVRKNGYLDLFGNDSNKLLDEWQKSSK